jgi:aspartyl-tRNA(Asn)/glutamyl-tRNA(Gln) amidotransferase subunit A
MSTDLHDLGVAQLAAKLAARDVSSVELTQHFLARIEQNASLGAFLATDSAVSLVQARAADARLAAGERTPLLGVPLAHKDIFVTRDFPTTAGSKMLENYRSPFDATVVGKLAAAGMVTLGKLNCDEFAMGSGNENSAYKPVLNPWDSSRIPGGCSRYGMVAFASSLDQAGPMARSALDCALLLSRMAGPDLDRDSTSLDLPALDYATDLIAVGAGGTGATPLKGLRIGLPAQFFGAGCSTDVLTAVRAALAEFETLGATLVDVDLPLTELSIPVYYVIAPAEASSNLSRFDGVRYGHRAASYGDLTDMYKKSRSEGFGDEVTRRIMIGTYVLSHGYYDAYYLKAQKIRRLIAEDFQKAFAQCDIIAGPVSPTVAWKIGENASDPVASYLADIYTLSSSLAGLPGMSVPAGFGAHNMPVGLQLIGNYFKEAQLLGAAHQFQLATDWHTRQPPGL